MRIISIQKEEDLPSRTGETKNDGDAACYSAPVTDL